MILVPISIGELIDKIIILEIKLNKIKDIKKLINIKKEFKMLNSLFKNNNIKLDFNFKKFKNNLKKINLKLWIIEDKIRRKEFLKKFDSQFIKLARSVYINNDKRAEIKKEINLFYGSCLMEEKSYQNYN